MVTIKLYSTSYCPYCHAAKRFLETKSLEYEEIMLSSKEELQELIEKTGFQTVPQIFFNDTLIGGYSDLIEYSKTQEFKDLIK